MQLKKNKQYQTIEGSKINALKKLYGLTETEIKMLFMLNHRYQNNNEILLNRLLTK